MCGLLVDYSDVFIICLDSRSDGTHSILHVAFSFTTCIIMVVFSVKGTKQILIAVCC